MADGLKESYKNVEKTLSIKVIELKDNSGLVYLGGEVSSADLAPYLQQMKLLLNDDFVKYRQNQALRDHQTFHVTLINPFEYKEVNQNKIQLGKSLNVRLLGLGQVAREEKSSYFVVVQSSQAQFYRQQLALANKDFHVTLGFSPQDIYGVSKNSDTLVIPVPSSF
jgi:hypothetical protein